MYLKTIFAITNLLTDYILESLVVADRVDNRQKKMYGGRMNEMFLLIQEMSRLLTKTFSAVQQVSLPQESKRIIADKIPFDSDAAIKTFFKDEANVNALDNFFNSLKHDHELSNKGLEEFLTVRYQAVHIWSDKFSG